MLVPPLGCPQEIALKGIHLIRGVQDFDCPSIWLEGPLRLPDNFSCFNAAFSNTNPRERHDEVGSSDVACASL